MKWSVQMHASFKTCSLSVLSFPFQAVLPTGASPALPVWPPRDTANVSVSPCWTISAASLPSVSQWGSPCGSATASKWGQNSIHFRPQVLQSSHWQWLVVAFADGNAFIVFYLFGWRSFAPPTGRHVQRLSVHHFLQALLLVPDVPRNEAKEHTGASGQCQEHMTLPTQTAPACSHNIWLPDAVTEGHFCVSNCCFHEHYWLSPCFIHFFLPESTSVSLSSQ